MDGLVVLRRLFLSLLVAPFLILFVLTQIDSEVGHPQTPLTLAVVALGILGAGAARWTSVKALDTSSPAHVAQSYRTLFFLGFALNEAALLISFVLVFVLEALWPYLVAFPFFLVGMYFIAPSRSNLGKRQEQLHRQGSTTDLVQSLNEPVPPRT